MLDDTIAAVATAPGKAGISVIRISGENAYGVARLVFKPLQGNKSLAEARGYTALYGTFVQDGIPLDEGIALCFRAPHSYTGEDVVELSCHGGQSVTESVLESCFLAGARPAAAGEFTRRAVMSGRISLTQAEAVMDIIDAESRRAAVLARSAMEGSLFRKIQKIRQELTAHSAHLAAWTDFPEEDVPEVTQADYRLAIESAAAEMDALIKRYNAGNLIRRGVDVAIVGSPNVGKSTLFNLLTGEASAIVTPVAGTTRDVIRQRVEIDGILFHFSDTAGLHETQDIVEKEGIRRSKQELDKASLIVAVFDGSLPLEKEQRQLAQSCAGRPSLAIINKSDVGNQVEEAELREFFTKVVTVSAHHPGTQRVLEQAILEIVQLADVDTDAGMLANQRQFEAAITARDALRQAQEALAQGFGFDAAGVCVEDALKAFSTLTGEDASEEVISEIFEKFCVGK